ncbi:MAG: peptide/nickel transport system substrate-binding protein [Solirubrobacteraceae bacterium]|nr:peptide/nickel transport system substrate-binding protein [Solirubrobacteraceae bacterium]
MSTPRSHSLSRVLLVCAALAASGCANKNGLTNSGGGSVAKTGGELTVLSLGDVTSLDPGAWYYAYDYQALAQPTQRALYGFRPADTTPSPDLAAGMPQSSGDGRTVTIKIKPNIYYSPPLQQRTVTSDDVKYAIERTFLPAVRNGYAPTYYGEIEGVADFRSGAAQDIAGIQTPDDTTLVLRLKRATGVISNAQALALPGTVPVPKDYAQKYDGGATSTYGSHQVFTGPYMIANDGKGKVTGYEQGRRLRLVRNPSWDRSTDQRPARLDKLTFSAGNGVESASRRILSGKHLASGDYAAPPVNVLRSALSTRRDQVVVVPSQGVRFIALNTTVKPFNNTNVRRAAAAAIDREALRVTRGGPPLGTIATHFLAPSIPGFAQAGGVAGTADVMRDPRGDLALARRYMRKAGYASGRYSGPPLQMVGDDVAPGLGTAAAVARQLGKLGFRFQERQVPRTESFNTYCGVPRTKVAICPNGFWGKDFFDAQGLLDPVFDGERIRTIGNVNWAHVDDAELNAGFDIAAAEIDPQKRAELYAEIDRTVSGRAFVIPWLWDNQVAFASQDVTGVVNRFTASWDMSYMALR